MPESFRIGFPREQIPYTVVQIGSAASHLTYDLTFSGFHSEEIDRALLINQISENLFALSFVWFILLSYVSAGLSGLLVFGRWRGYANWGFWNLLTIVGLIVAVMFLTEGWEKRGKFWRSFTVIFTSLTLVAWAILVHLVWNI